MKFGQNLVKAVLVALLACTLISAGCNTWKGAGKDVERAGEKMQGND